MNAYLQLDEIVFTFGRFKLFPARRLLTRDGNEVKMGSRALDLLVALVERAGKVVRKDELMSRVWPNSVVEDANLRVNICALRRVLGDDGIGSRYIVYVARQGYMFVAPLEDVLNTLTRETARVLGEPRYSGRTTAGILRSTAHPR
jgi:DNA-binding winged helix-turn-helix (wHTH) protein